MSPLVTVQANSNQVLFLHQSKMDDGLLHNNWTQLKPSSNERWWEWQPLNIHHYILPIILFKQHLWDLLSFWHCSGPSMGHAKNMYAQKCTLKHLGDVLFFLLYISFKHLSYSCTALQFILFMVVTWQQTQSLLVKNLQELKYLFSKPQRKMH